MVEEPDGVRVHRLVGRDDAVIELVVARNEQVELERPVEGFGDALTEHEHPVLLVPGLGTPSDLCIGPAFVDVDPSKRRDLPMIPLSSGKRSNGTLTENSTRRSSSFLRILMSKNAESMRVSICAGERRRGSRSGSRP
ncbi:MAG: hypothetical protein U0359_16070 [Byssovorax sp.]